MTLEQRLLRRIDRDVGAARCERESGCWPEDVAVGVAGVRWERAVGLLGVRMKRQISGCRHGWSSCLGHRLEARPRRSGQQAWIDRPRCHVLAQAGLRVPRLTVSLRHGNPGLRTRPPPDRLECACRPLREHLGLAGSRAPTNEILSFRVRGDHGRLHRSSHRRRLRLGSRIDECHPRRFVTCRGRAKGWVGRLWSDLTPEIPDCNLLFMYHALPRNRLLATNKIEVAFRSVQGDLSAHGSGFWVRNGHDVLFVTNRHMIDLEYKAPKYGGHGYSLSSVEILSFDASGRSGRLRLIHADILTHESAEIEVALMRVRRHESPDRIMVVPVGVEIIADASLVESQLEWGAQVSFSSFQPWRDTQTERPIVRSGILASDPAHSFGTTTRRPRRTPGWSARAGDRPLPSAPSHRRPTPRAGRVAPCPRAHASLR